MHLQDETTRAGAGTKKTGYHKTRYTTNREVRVVGTRTVKYKPIFCTSYLYQTLFESPKSSAVSYFIL